MVLSDLPTKLITLFDSRNCSSFEMGQGQSHIYYLNFEKNSMIGPHIAGYEQLFLVLSGNGWVAGQDDCPQPIESGEIAHFSEGERHSKGSYEGMTVMMIQLENLKWP